MKMWCSAAIHFGGSLSSPIFTSSTVRVKKAFDVNCRPQACIERTTRADVIYVIVFALETQTLVTADVLFFLSFFFPRLTVLLTYLLILFIYFLFLLFHSEPWFHSTTQLCAPYSSLETRAIDEKFQHTVHIGLNSR